ncbi:ATP-binding protein [Bdellovibrionota bacterium FG-1]
MELPPELNAQLVRVLSSIEMLLPPCVEPIDWTTCSAANWRRRPYSGYLEPIRTSGALLLEDLLGIDAQKNVVEANTRQFLSGVPANNILLWGSRGTGKSSLVRALLSTYAPQGLRIIQVDKDDLVHLPTIVDEIRHLPYRFVLFSDDLSFDTGDSSYKTLKSALDGAVYAPPENVLIYVTSNRRHLVPEYEDDNRGGMMVNNEIHHGEAVEEKISLSGRFGLWVAFHPIGRDQYLQLVRRWVEKLSDRHGTRVEWTSETEEAAEHWSQEKGDRSGRIAVQFARNWVGQFLLARRTHSSQKAVDDPQ